jgi:NAD(P)-dependent dehydrogenase (short-subunit alcohol dehydrogenase family)
MRNEYPSKAGVVAVTGASRGIGAAIAVELARRGFTVACLTRHGSGPVDASIEDVILPRLVNLACDITDDRSLRSAFAALDERGLRLRHLVCNAGIHAAGPSADFSTADAESLLRTNVVGTFASCREAHRYLGPGSAILTLGSFFERIGTPGNALYSASKAAVGALARVLASEWARDGIAVVNVAPGYVETDLNRDHLARPEVKAFLARRIPMGRHCLPKEIARVVATLLGEDLRIMTGQTLYLDGGLSINHG